MIKAKNHHVLSIETEIICMDGHCPKSHPYVVLNGLKKHLNLLKIS